MNGDYSHPHFAPGLQVMLGKEFTFTQDDLTLLHDHLLKAHSYFERRNVGWQVRFIREITFINRIIRGALDRAHANPPTKVGNQLPLI